MTKALIQTLLALPLEERAEVAEMLWKSIEQEPLPEWQKRLLDERLRDADQHPDAFVSWEEVEAEALAQVAKRGAS